MSSKLVRMPSASTVASGTPLRHEVENLIRKERFKEAVKQAKLLFKQEGTPENHRSLEEAYFRRARELLERGMPDSAMEVARHLLEFGLTGAGWTDEFVQLLVKLGLVEEARRVQAQTGGPELTDDLLLLAADQAVIHPARMKVAAAETAREVNLIRESLEKLAAGEDEKGLGLLRDLPRSSPMADWKIFVRGLAAYYQGDSEGARANWSRLDANRQAIRITEPLTRLAGGRDARASDLDLALLEKAAFGEPLLERLGELPRLLAEQNWEQVNRAVVSLRFPLRRLDPKLSERLTRILIPAIIQHASGLDPRNAERVLKLFTRAAEPLAIDPRWNRFMAIAADLMDVASETVHDCWMKYIDDLESIPGLGPAERVLAQAMVWNRVAVLYRDDVMEIAGAGSELRAFARMLAGPPDDADVTELKQRTVQAIERSLALAPQHLPTYRLLIGVQGCWESQRGVEDAARRLLEKFPDDLETLTLVLNSTYKHERLKEAMEYVERIRILKPFDSAVRDREAVIRIGLARQCALASRWEEGREHFRFAEELSPYHLGAYTFLARKSLFEAKASQRDESDRFLNEALAASPVPAPVWLVMAIESSRYQMSAATTNGYFALWKSELKKKCQTQAAGEMASLINGYLELDVKYPARESHVRELVAYLKRSSRVKYRQADIEHVCDFLKRIPRERSLWQKFAKEGVKLYPRSARLNYLAAMALNATRRFPLIPPAAIKHLEIAAEIAEASGAPADAELLQEIREALTMFKELSGLTRIPFFPGVPFSDRGFADLQDEDWDDDDDMWDDGPGSGSAEMPKNKTKSKKR